jgi:arginyl-tRNA synthetase
MILDSIRHRIDVLLEPWAAKQSVAVPAYSLDDPPPGIEADLASNLPLILSKSLKKSPKIVAAELQNILSSDKNLFESVAIAGAGFLNFKVSLQAWQGEIRAILQQKETYGRSAEGAGKKVLIEFVSANPTGPLHVGHGRGAALGDSLALILAHRGYAVTREYYINDAGNQVQLLGESVQARCRELEGKPTQLPEEGYHGDYVRDVAKTYLAQHPQGVDDPGTIISFALRHLQQEIDRDLQDFGVRFDSWFSEASVVQKGLVDKYVALLKEKGFVEEYEDAVWFVNPAEHEEQRDHPSSASKEDGLAATKKGQPDKDRVLKRRDGRWTYFATDIAYHADKFERGFDRLIDIWGADHHGYVPRVKGSVQALGFDPGRLHILLYQLVSLSRNGVPVSMSKRSGDFITLREVLDEVGKDACRFFFALRGPNTTMDFDLELAKKHSNDNPVYYLQYAHARICSIFRQPDAAGSVLEADLGRLQEKEERDLMRRLSSFESVLRVCIREDSPHPLATYLLDLCRQFHHFYDHHRVLGEERTLTLARLALIAAVREVLRSGLALLGVSAPESM